MQPISLTRVLLFVTCWTGLLAASNAAAADREFRSPPLPILDSRAFVLVAPAGWQVATRDPAGEWRHTAYEFALAPDRPNSLAGGAVNVEILQHGIERARLHRDLEGERFRSRGGQSGFLNIAEYQPGTRDWYFAVPVLSTESALIVRVMFKRGGYWTQDAFARSFYRSLRFARRRGVDSRQT